MQSLLNTPAVGLKEVYQNRSLKNSATTRSLLSGAKQYGIQALLTPPENLTVNTINKYLELKARGMI